MATTQEQLAQQIGLTPADIQEYKDTGSYGSAAQAKINAYKANPTPIPATPTGNMENMPNQVNTQNQNQVTPTSKPVYDTGNGEMSDGTTKGQLVTPPNVSDNTNINTGINQTQKLPNYNTNLPKVGGTIANGEQTIPAVDTTIIKKETTPNGEITTTSTPKNTAITNTTPWDQTGKTINDLAQMVQARYKNGTLQGNSIIGNDEYGVPSTWTIGADGFPHKEQNFQNSNDFLNVLSGGGQINSKYNSDPRFIEAKHIYDTLNSYKGASSDVLYSAMATNKLVPGSYAYNDLVKMSGGIETPEMLKAKARYEQQMNTNAINRDIDINTGTNKPPVNPTETVSDNIVKNKGMDYATEFQKDIVNNPEINNLATDLNNTTQSIKELEQAKSKTLKKIIADHPGISMGMALGIAQNENNDIDTELQGLYNKQATQQANLTYKTDLASKMFDYKVKQNEENIAAQKILDERAYQEQQKLEDRAYAEQQATNKLEQEYQYKYGDINSTNPNLRNIAIQNAVADMYDRYKDIPGLESESAKVQKVQDYMSGKTTGTPMTGSEAIARVENEIRGSKRYADYLADEKAKMALNKTQFVTIGKDDNGNDIKGFVDPVTKQVTQYNPGDISNVDIRDKANLYPNDAGVKNNNPAGLTFNDVFAKTLTNAGIQFTKGTPRKSNEGGNYFSFPNVGEGLKAYNLLWDSSSYTNKTVQQALGKWGTGSLNLPGINQNTKIGDLTPAQKSQLQQEQIKIESPGMYQELSKGGYFNQNGTPAQSNVGPIDARTGVPITYARRIKNMIPTALQNSDLEAKNINKTIKSLYSQGVPAEDAALSYMGVDLKPNVKQIGINMIDTLKGTDAPPRSYTAIADALNKGNTAGATQLLENTLYKQREIKPTDINEIGNNIKNGQNLINRINTLKNKFGPISGRENDWALTLQNDPETQRVISDMTNYIAKYRNGIAGTSVTGNEEDFLKGIIPTIKDNPDNAIAKIKSNMMQSFNGLNTIRDTIGLPELQDPRSAYDINLRKQAFTGRGSGQSTSNTPAPSSVKTQNYTSKSGKTYNINDYR